MNHTLHDYITVVKNPTPCNKRFTKTAGGVQKTPNANIFNATATTTKVSNVSEMAALLREVGEDPNATLILGYIPGTTTYNLVTGKKIEEMCASVGITANPGGTGEFATGGHTYYARLKANFSPSSWFVFDYDEPPGMPEHLKAPGAVAWLESLSRIVPGIRETGCVMLPSSSSRITVNGISNSTSNKHMLLQAQDATDVERFGKMLFLHALKAGLGFHSTTKGGAKRRQTIFDPTTFSRERLLFEGKPVVAGDGLSVGPVLPGESPGGRLDTSLTESITEKIEGVEVGRSSGGYLTYDYESLTSDIEIETKDHGAMTIIDYVEGDFGKIRAQSPFRASESMAAYLNMHTTSGSAFLFDVGSQTKYLFAPSVDELFAGVEKPMPPIPPAPPVFTGVPLPPTALAINVEKLAAPPVVSRAPALAIVAGTDYEAELETGFDSRIAELRNAAPNSPEKVELLKTILTGIERLDDEGQKMRWNETLRAAKGDEVRVPDLEKLRKEVKRTIKRTAPVGDDTPVHRKPLFGWPDVNSEDKPYCTIDNAKYMFERLDVKLRYNRMTKDLDAQLPWTGLSDHNAVNNAFVHLESIGQTNGLNRDSLIRYALTISDDDTFNPVDEWIQSKPWDGVSRFPVLMASLKYKENELVETLVRKWLISCVAAVYELSGVRSQGVLTLQGPQHTNKSRWLGALVGDMKHFFLYHGDFRVDKKDSHILAFGYWIAELPEVDVIMPTKDKEEQFKSIVDRTMDEIRRPYDRAAGKWARSTIFCATANPQEFLKDTTGTRRSWTVAIEETFPDRMPDMQQLWAEVKTWFDTGEVYNLTKEQVSTLNESNNEFSTVSPIEEEILGYFDWESEDRPQRMSATQVIKAIHPGSKVLAHEAKAAGEIITKLTGEKPKKGNKGKMWYMPLAGVFNNLPT